MANVTWVGKQIARAWKKTLTIGTADPGGTITLTCGGTQVCVITPTTTNTTTTASEIAVAASAAGGCFSELQFTSSGAVVTITGPADGAPVTLTKTDGGSNSTTLTTVFAPLSPHDLSDGANYSGGALPSGTDTLIFEDSAVDAKYNADALAAITLTQVIRRATYTGKLGLPTTNAAGFPEYRVTQLQLKSDSVYWEGADSDQDGQFRVKNVFTASAVTWTIQGMGDTASVGAEVLELEGLPASSILTITGSSIAIAPLQGQTCTILTLKALNSTLTIGAGATLSGTVRVDNCQVAIKASWTTSLTMDGQSNVEVLGAAAGVLILDGGYMTWHSTGNPGNSPAIGGGATLDLNTAPAALTIGGTVAAYAGGALLDAAGRGGNYSVQFVRCTPQEFNWVTSSHRTFAMT